MTENNAAAPSMPGDKETTRPTYCPESYFYMYIKKRDLKRSLFFYPHPTRLPYLAKNIGRIVFRFLKPPVSLSFMAVLSVRNTPTATHIQQIEYALFRFQTTVWACFFAYLPAALPVPTLLWPANK